MSEINMKSELLGSDVKGVTSRRQKMFKLTTHHTNGGGGDRTEVNMVAAMQDHLSCCSKSGPGAVATQDYLRTAKSAVATASLPYELDHMYANCGGGDMRSTSGKTDESHQLKCIKELLFLHLDLIQQQQEQLGQKERQIASARQENVNLKQQLEDTNRRLSALEREHEKLKRYKSTTADLILNAGCVNRYRICSGNSRRRNRSSSSVDSPSKRSRTCAASGHDAPSSHEKKASEDRSSEGKGAALLHRRPDPLLRTDIMYYSPVGESIRSPDSPRSDETVLVPCWRLRPISSCYQMEGTENLDDDIFLKRHQKLEIDEKRRKRLVGGETKAVHPGERCHDLWWEEVPKRWDIQRLREQRLQEKLKRGRSGNKDAFSGDNPNLATFYPRVEDVQFIEVSDTVPISAFGYPIPLIESSEFQIPWLNSADSTWSEIKRCGRLADGGSKR